MYAYENDACLPTRTKLGLLRYISIGLTEQPTAEAELAEHQEQRLASDKLGMKDENLLISDARYLWLDGGAECCRDP